MELSFKSFIFFGAIALTGLSAGLFYAWSVSVIPGTQRLGDPAYLEAMQSINRAILNPKFFIIFFGSVAFLSVASIYQLHDNKLAFWLMLSASILYLLGTVGVTGLGNVPLNNELDLLQLGELNINQMADFRSYYETNWNRFHFFRMLFAVLSFLLALLTLFIETKKL